MAKVGTFSHEVRVWVDDSMAAGLRAEAGARGVTVADVVRGLVEIHLAGQAVTTAMPMVEAALEPLLERTFGRHVNRLAALTSKAVLQAATAKWLVAAALEVTPVPAKDAKIAYPDQDKLLEDARRFALEDLRVRHDPERTQGDSTPAPDAQ